MRNILLISFIAVFLDPFHFESPDFLYSNEIFKN